VEQLMKQVAVGRKNWLFPGSPDAGIRAATLLTLISTALRNDLDVWAYLKDVLNKLLAGSTDYESLRADLWKQSHPESVRTYRSEERRDTANRTKLTRAQRRLQNAGKTIRPSRLDRFNSPKALMVLEYGYSPRSVRAGCRFDGVRSFRILALRRLLFTR
jgi:hypothetical protein